MFGKKPEKADPKPAPSGALASSSALGAPQDAPLEGPRPLFYRDPRPLTLSLHEGLRLRGGDLSFAEATNSTPIVVSEFAEAARFFPILFAGEGAFPVVLLGLEDKNLFVEKGAWQEGAYMPAYVRRYPFVFIAAPDGDKFALGVDMAAPQIEHGGDGAPLYADGKPALVTQQALAFCQAFQADHAMTRAFAQALLQRDLLVERRADIVLPGGRGTILQGFRVIDPARLANLSQDDVYAWHRNGWLALAHFHLASLGAFRDLLRRHGAHERLAA